MQHNKKYWIERSILLEKKLLNKGESYVKDLDVIYGKISLDIEKDLRVWYSKFAKNNSISIIEAKKWLNANELKEFKWTVEEYVKHAEKFGVNKQWIKQLENASAKYHISRLEVIKMQLQNQLEKLNQIQLDGVSNTMKDIYTEGYFNTLYDFQVAFGVGFSLSKFNTDELDKILAKPWAIDGANFSDRIWNNKTALVNTLHQELTSMVVRGEDPAKTINRVASRLNANKSNASRLVMTESAYFASKSQEDSYNASGVEKYQLLATLDNRTSEICESIDGEIFLMKDYEPGVTAPPFHPNCRTTTIPYYDDTEVGTRIARGANGTTYAVPNNITYDEWYKTYVNK